LKIKEDDMSEDVSRRKALSLLGAALGLALALMEDEAEAETLDNSSPATAGMKLRQQQRRAGRHQRRTGQPATAPAEAPAGAAPAGFMPPMSQSQFIMKRGY
jgi:hypothetical protein